VKALTLLRPWSHAISHGPKRIENRTWKPPAWLVGRHFAIHAGKGWDTDCADVADRATESYASPPQAWCPTGIVAVATIALVTTPDNVEAQDLPWAFGPWCWVLRDVIALPEPVPHRGAQGLWDISPDAVAIVREMVRRDHE
jgi:hypothetical protein